MIRAVLRFAVVLVASCTASIVATYDHELELCSQRGIAARDLALYERCARAVDHSFCETRGYRCDAGGAR